MCVSICTPEKRQEWKQVSNKDGGSAGFILRTIGGHHQGVWKDCLQLCRGGVCWAQPEGVTIAESEEPHPLDLGKSS